MVSCGRGYGLMWLHGTRVLSRYRVPGYTDSILYLGMLPGTWTMYNIILFHTGTSYYNIAILCLYDVCALSGRTGSTMDRYCLFIPARCFNTGIEILPCMDCLAIVHVYMSTCTYTCTTCTRVLECTRVYTTQWINMDPTRWHTWILDTHHSWWGWHPAEHQDSRASTVALIQYCSPGPGINTGTGGDGYHLKCTCT